jgi:hypothetical protein
MTDKIMSDGTRQVKRMRDIGILFLFLLLIGIIIYLILSRPTVEKPSIIKHETAISREKVSMDSLADVQKAIIQKMTMDSLKNLEAANRFKTRISKLENKLAMVKEEVRPWLDSIPILKTYTDLQDSVISAMAGRIDSLETERSIERMKFKKLILAGDEKFNAAIEINSHFKAIDEIRKKDNRRLKKVNRLLMVSVPIAFVGGIVLAK